MYVCKINSMYEFYINLHFLTPNSLGSRVSLIKLTYINANTLLYSALRLIQQLVNNHLTNAMNISIHEKTLDQTNIPF